MRLIWKPVAAYGLAWLMASAGGGGSSCLAEGPEPSPGRGPHVPEFVRMFRSIAVQGAEMGPGSGWFGPGQTGFGWEWLAKRLDTDGSGGVEETEWKLGPELFARLDRDGDGVIRREDLDWSMGSPFMARMMAGRARFSQLDADSNGKVTREEFLRLFSAASEGREFLTPEELGAIFEAAKPGGAGRGQKPGREGRQPGGQQPAEEGATAWIPRPLKRANDYLFSAPPGAPTRWVLFKGLFDGEIGSPYEGPAVGEEAPDFLLPTQDGSEMVRLSAYKGQVPVVLVFGSFT